VTAWCFGGKNKGQENNCGRKKSGTNVGANGSFLVTGA